jgi:Zn-dependent peptidase ImmA (M78 family)
MSTVTWSLQTGDPRRLAWRLSLIDDAAGDHAVAAAVRASWGSFELWADGSNFCAHDDQGEQLEAAHWYLLPVAEWLVDNWDPVFHEQRLPLPDGDGAATAANRAMAALDAAPDRVPARWGLPAATPDKRLADLQEWAFRHRLAAAAPEAALPDVWLRRSGGLLEISLGDTDTRLFDGMISWSLPQRVACLPVAEAARATERALRALLVELVERGDDGRAADALRRLEDAVSPARDDARLAWLVGLRGDTHALDDLRASLDELSGPVPEPSGRQVRPTGVVEAVPVATLFGSLSPDVTRDDVGRLIDALRSAASPGELLPALDALAESADPADFAGLQDGQAGGELGDAVARLLPHDDGRVEILRYFADVLGLSVRPIRLSDPTIRAVTLLHEDGRAVVAVNNNYERGTAQHVVRFTLAHELAHLIYDRAAAGRLAIASGPWTPERIERRANGFAAGVLMPENLLREHARNHAGWNTDPRELGRMARDLGVGLTALAERLHNVGMLSRGAADGLLDALVG